MDLNKDYYLALGLPPTASPKEIKHAFRTMVKVLHPDRFDLITERDEHEKATILLRDLIEAYSILSDPNTKDKYDYLQKNRFHENSSSEKTRDSPKAPPTKSSNRSARENESSPNSSPNQNYTHKKKKFFRLKFAHVIIIILLFAIWIHKESEWEHTQNVLSEWALSDRFGISLDQGPLRKALVTFPNGRSFNTLCRLFDDAVWLDETNTGSKAFSKGGWYALSNDRNQWHLMPSNYKLPCGEIVKENNGNYKTYERHSDNAIFLHPKFFGDAFLVVPGPGWYIRNQDGIYGKVESRQGVFHLAMGAIKHILIVINR